MKIDLHVHTSPLSPDSRMSADEAIETSAQMTIPEIFSTYGEGFFRDGERRVIARLMGEGSAGGPQVKVIGTGWVASSGAHIYLGASKENRFCLPNTRFLLHQPTGGVRGQASDIEIEAEEIVKMRERVNRVIARETGQPYEKIVKDTQRNFWMSAEAAVEYGLVSKIIHSATEA